MKASSNSSIYIFFFVIFNAEIISIKTSIIINLYFFLIYEFDFDSKIDSKVDQKFYRFLYKCWGKIYPLSIPPLITQVSIFSLVMVH